MDHPKKKVVAHTPTTTPRYSSDERNWHHKDLMCPKPCFFCTMEEPDSSVRRAGVAKCFKELQQTDSQDLVVMLSGLWHIAMTRPSDPEFPSIGIFRCMVSLLNKALNDRNWLLRNQNIYVPYYAAHVIGSYTMNKEEFAQLAVQSGVISPLMELLRGKITWVEQRVAVRALGHLASYKSTFSAVADYEQEIVKLTMNLASSCLEVVYVDFVGVTDRNKRTKYHCDLLTRGIGDLEMENRKAEEWASQLQCWCLHVLNCFASKQMSLRLICKLEFLEDLCDMWGGLVNHTSPSGVGLIRVLCYSKVGREMIVKSHKVINNLCNLSTSSDDWQYMGIDCLLMLLKDPDTRYIAIERSATFLVDLVELKRLGVRSNLGEAITRALLLEYNHSKMEIHGPKVQQALRELWYLKVEKRNKEKRMSEEKLEGRRVLVGLIKQEAKNMFRSGKLEEAVVKYSEALELCPLRFRKERMTLYSNRAQCHVLLRDPDSAASDSTRALCLSNPSNSHLNSLWRRSQAYDMKCLTKESLMDCLIYVQGCIQSDGKRSVKIPYYASRMINKQMDATWLFGAARSKVRSNSTKNMKESKCECECECKCEHYDHLDVQSIQQDDGPVLLGEMFTSRDFMSGLSTINIEEPTLANKGRSLDKAGKAYEDSCKLGVNLIDLSSMGC